MATLNVPTVCMHVWTLEMEAVGVFQGQLSTKTSSKIIDVNECESAVPYNLYYIQYQEIAIEQATQTAKKTT